jgi:hypothetical protein
MRLRKMRMLVKTSSLTRSSQRTKGEKMMKIMNEENNDKLV